MCYLLLRHAFAPPQPPPLHAAAMQLAQREYEVSLREAAVQGAEELAARYSAKEEALWSREQELKRREAALAKAEAAAAQVRPAGNMHHGGMAIMARRWYKRNYWQNWMAMCCT